MVAVETRILPGEAQPEYEKAYRRYIGLDACLGPYFRANYLG